MTSRAASADVRSGSCDTPLREKMSMNFSRVLSVVLLSILVGWQPASGGEKRYIEVRWIDTTVPSIELLQDNFPRVSLPRKLKESIARHLPDYRLPDSQDYGGDWVEFYDYRSPEERESKVPLSPERIISQRVPFIAFGDFNHDKVQDIAALMTEKKNDSWKLVVFHGSKTGYQPIVIRSRRSKDVYIQRVGITRNAKCTNGLECLEFYLFESSSFEYVWKDGRYIEVSTAD